MAVRERLEDLLQLPDADVLAGTEGRKGGKVGLAVVVRDENLGSDGLGSGNTLVHGHRSLSWVRQMDPYEHLSIYSSSFQPTITFSGDFSKSGIVPGVVNIQKLPISALFYLVFGIKKPGNYPWNFHNLLIFSID